MPQSKRFAKRLSSLVNVAGFGTRTRQKLSAFVLLILAVGGLPTAAHALNVEVFVNGASVLRVPAVPNDVATPSSSATICPPNTIAPCTGTKGNLTTVAIPTNTYGGVLQVLAGAQGQAKVETNALTIGASATITNTLNVVGSFRMLVPGELKIVVTSDFNLRPGTTTTLSGGGTWQALGRGASKCEKLTDTGPYQNSLCAISDNTVDSANSTNDCTLCRSYGFTDTGYVLRFDPATNGWTKPASGVVVKMQSDVTLRNVANTVTKNEPVGGVLQTTIPAGSLVENGRFYINLQQNELVPCEPFLEPCNNSEKKSSTLVFTGMSAKDQVNLPATSTDLGTSDLGVLLANVQKIEVPIDVQPIDPVPSNVPGFFLPGVNNDWGQSQGMVQVLALSTPPTNDAPGVDVCALDNPLAFLSMANSALVPSTNVNEYLVDNRCIGLRFQFDRGAINATIEGTTEAAKQTTCAGLPVAALIIRDAVQVQTSYDLVPEQPRKASYEVSDPESCSLNGATVTCNVTVPIIGTQAIKCAVPAGG